jgi:hypothetical protein
MVLRSGVQKGMQIWTPEGRSQPWPYGVDWFMDTHTMPIWVREQQRQQQGAGGVGGGSSASSKS